MQRETWKILHLEASPGWGGQEMRSLKEAIGMRKRGYQIFFGVQKGGGLVKKAREEGFLVKEMQFAKKYWYHTFFQLLHLLLKEKIDLVNTHSPMDGWIGGVVAKIMRKPVIRTRHLSTSIRGGFNAKLIYNKLADYLVTTCSSILPEIVKKSKRSVETSVSIPTGVDPTSVLVKEEDISAFKEKHGIKKEDFLIGTACFVRSWKGIGDFIEAANILRNVSSLKWIIIGGGFSESYKKRVKELSLNNVIFTDHLPFPYPAIAALDVFALLSTAHEGVSQAILQAAFLQKPLIATPTGGLLEVCLDGITGIAVPKFSPSKVADAVLEMKSDPDICLEMGKRAKKLVLEKFTLDAMLDKMESIYHSIGLRIEEKERKEKK